MPDLFEIIPRQTVLLCARKGSNKYKKKLFQITPVLNTGLSLSEPLQLYQGQSLDSSAGYMYTL